MDDINCFLSRICVVLTRPEGQANIGAVCRAMKTMGLTQLRLVSPALTVISEIKQWSVGAFDIYEQSVQFSSLEEAVADAVLVAGTSRRIGKNRKFFALTPRELAIKAASYGDGKIAVVFGNEKNGLDDRELKCCHLLVNIPTSSLYGSLNLAQAVQIVSYELFQTAYAPQQFNAITADDVVRLARSMTQHLDAIGLFTITGDYGYAYVQSFLTSILGRSALSSDEQQFLATMFQRIHHIKVNPSIQPPHKWRKQ